MLPDGDYEAFVVDAEADASGDVLRLDLTILTGEHKGEVVSIHATGLGVAEVDALGLPATIVVRDGLPSVAVEP